jgi:hypothetical protein
MVREIETDGQKESSSPKPVQKCPPMGKLLVFGYILKSEVHIPHIWAIQQAVAAARPRRLESATEMVESFIISMLLP